MPYMHFILDDVLHFGGIVIKLAHPQDKREKAYFIIENSDGDMLIFPAQEENK